MSHDPTMFAEEFEGLTGRDGRRLVSTEQLIEPPQACRPVLDLVRPEIDGLRWYAWLIPASLVALCVVLLVSA
jgi:hypothetical protein